MGIDTAEVREVLDIAERAFVCEVRGEAEPYLLASLVELVVEGLGGRATAEQVAVSLEGGIYIRQFIRRAGLTRAQLVWAVGRTTAFRGRG